MGTVVSRKQRNAKAERLSGMKYLSTRMIVDERDSRHNIIHNIDKDNTKRIEFLGNTLQPDAYSII